MNLANRWNAVVSSQPEVLTVAGYEGERFATVARETFDGQTTETFVRPCSTLAAALEVIADDAYRGYEPLAVIDLRECEVLEIALSVKASLSGERGDPDEYGLT